MASYCSSKVTRIVSDHHAKWYLDLATDPDNNGRVAAAHLRSGTGAIRLQSCEMEAGHAAQDPRHDIGSDQEAFVTGNAAEVWR